MTDVVINLSAPGYVHVAGRFGNVSANVLKFLHVSVIFEDSSGKMVTTERTFSEPSNLPPGAIGTFGVIKASDSRFADVKLNLSCDDEPVEWQDESGKHVQQ